MSEVLARKKHYTLITANKGKFELNLKEVWKYRDLIWLFTKRDFILVYKQTILGPAWVIINPLLTSIIYTIVFGGIAGISTDGVPQLLFYLAGASMWSFFSTSITKNSSTFITNAPIFGKVYFPRLTIPFSTILLTAIQFGVQMLLVLVFLIYYLARGAIHPNWWAWILIPFILLHIGIMALGFGIIVSSLTTKYRDLALLVSFGVTLWMYGTPVVYPLSQISNPVLLTIIKLNPVTMPMELFRYAVLGKGCVELSYYAVSLLITAIVFIFGVAIFNLVEKTFMDTV